LILLRLIGKDIAYQYKMGNEKNMEGLLLSYLRGAVSEKEREEVERWFNESPENRKLMEQLYMLERRNESLRCIREANACHSLEKVKQKIRKNRIHRLVTRVQRISAVLLLPFLMLTVYYMYHPKDVEREPSQMIKVSSAPGLVTSFMLPDGTKVWLNSDSQIEYPSSFDGNLREVAITGEAYFTVAKDELKPFLVNVNDAFKVRVTGTSFNVNAYPSTTDFFVTLVEGAVELVTAAEPEKSFLSLKPNEQSVWDTKNQSINVQHVNTLVVTSWKDGKLIFKNTPITEIAATLSKRYNAQFIISPRLKDYHFTGTFTNQQLAQILDHFKISSNIKYEIKGLDLNKDGTINNTIVELK